jgi:hypothetical protein
MRWSSHLPRFRLQIDVPRAIPQNSELLRLKSDYEKGGTTGVHVIAFLHPPAVAPVVASVVSKFTLCAHLASSPDWRPKPMRGAGESTHRAWNRLHLRRTLECAPLVWGAGRSNEQHSRKQHSTFKNHNQLWSSQIVGEFRQFPLDRQLSSRARASSCPGDWTAATRIRAAAFLVQHCLRTLQRATCDLLISVAHLQASHVYSHGAPCHPARKTHPRAD